MSKIITTEIFLQKAREIHGQKYDYSKTVYVSAKDKVCIICPEHGEFFQAPDKHLHGRGCPRCARPNSNLSQEEFIEKVVSVHGDRYDYSKTTYQGYNKSVIITCPIHGDFTIKANAHLKGSGCQRCGGSGRFSTSEFIERHRSIHGDRYDYSETNAENRYNNKICVICPEHGHFYKTITGHFHYGCPKCSRPLSNMGTDGFIKKAREVHGDRYSYERTTYKDILSKVIITCPEHGDIEVTPNNFLRGYGCKRCAVDNQAALQRARAASEFEAKARLIHGDKYDYSKVEYISAKDKVLIICPEHGEFWQDPNHHLQGNQCPLCTHRSWAYTTEEFIKRAKEVHGDRYDYSITEYKNERTTVKVICPEHGEFEIDPSYHANGGLCPVCTALNIESKQEKAVRELLERHGINYEREKKFPWLRRGRIMPLDFYLPQYNIAIECQGMQHFKEMKFFGGLEGYIDIQERDNAKKELCNHNNVTLLYYSDLRIRYPYPVCTSLEELLRAIKNDGNTLHGKQLELNFEWEP